jgi:hypothetical protein
MGLRAETHEDIRKEMATKIYGQLSDQDLTLLKKNSSQLWPTLQQPWEEATIDMQGSLLNQQST